MSEAIDQAFIRSHYDPPLESTRDICEPCPSCNWPIFAPTVLCEITSRFDRPRMCRSCGRMLDPLPDMSTPC